jgi:hypothetical protein
MKASGKTTKSMATVTTFGKMDASTTVNGPTTTCKVTVSMSTLMALGTTAST